MRRIFFYISTRGFDLTKDDLIRVAVIQKDNNSYDLIWSSHHIIMDGWYIGIVLGELFSIYGSLINNRKIHLDKVIPYIKYIKWLQGRDKDASRNYWKRYWEH